MLADNDSYTVIERPAFTYTPPRGSFNTSLSG